MTSSPSPKCGRRHVRRSFTLIELLVVIAIIGILAAILILSLSKAVEKSHRILCLNNLRQVAIGSTIYADTHDNKYIEARQNEVQVAGFPTRTCFLSIPGTPTAAVMPTSSRKILAISFPHPPASHCSDSNRNLHGCFRDESAPDWQFVMTRQPV